VKTRAAISREGAPAPIIESVELEAPRADEILVRIVATGICHTDLGCHSGKGRPTPKPIVLGHEGAGVVEQVGAAVTDIVIGDHVVLSGVSCGHCESCQNNRPTYCRDAIGLCFGGARAVGTSPLTQDGAHVHGSFFGQSSFASHVVAPARSAVRVPKDVPLHLMGPLGCGVITGAGAVIETFRVRPGQSIVVFGVGGVGLSAIMAARLSGAAQIVAVDLNPARLQLARELGATHAVQAGQGDVLEALRSIRPEGFNFSLNTTFVPEVYDQALGALGMEGVCGFVTAPRGPWSPNILQLLSGGRRLQGILGGGAAPRLFIPLLIEAWRQGRFPFDRMIKTYAFEDIAQAFADTASGAAIKPVLVMEKEEQ
jgi:aryl-alcohol dehydrogenase